MSGFRGVSAASDNRFTDKEKKLLKNMKFPKEFELPVDLKKVNWEVMKTWIAKRVTVLLGVEDEVLIGYVYEQLENVKTIDPRLLQINLTGFLEKNTSLFVKELWALLASASTTESGVPQAILDEKAEELRKRKEAQDQLNERVDKERKKRSEEDKREREERAKRQEERERQLKKDRERERERALEREAARQKEREAERQRQREREEERRRRTDRERDSDRRRREREAERRKDQEDRERERGLSSKRPLGDESTLPSAKRVLQDRSVSPPAELIEDAANGKDGRVRAPEEDRIKGKEKKKEKKSKEEKREKKEKKRLKKEARERRDASDSPDSDVRAEELGRQKSIEEDLRQKALRARQAA